MVTSTTLSVGEVQSLAVQVLGQLPAPWEKADVHVRATPSFDGDDALYVTAVFPDGAAPTADPQADFRIRLEDMLIARGDYRVVYYSTLSRSEFEELQRFQAEGPPDAA